MHNFKKFIVPTSDSDGCPRGTGFIIPNYFITAGHMFDETECISIIFDNNKYVFNRADAFYIRTPTIGSDEEAQDIAIFKFNSIDSPLKICGLMPNVNSLLLCYSVRPITGERDPYHLVTCECQVTKPFFNFFECDTNIILREGFSGSPLIHDNTVYGILSGCLDADDNPEKILFCSTKNLPIL